MRGVLKQTESQLIRKPLKRILRSKLTKWFNEAKLPNNSTLIKSFKKTLSIVSKTTLNATSLNYRKNSQLLEDNNLLDFFLRERIFRKKLILPKFRKKNKLLKKARKRLWRYKFKLPRRRRRRKILRKQNKL